MSNFTFGHNVFKSCLLLLRQKASAGGKGLNSYDARLIRIYNCRICHMDRFHGVLNISNCLTVFHHCNILSDASAVDDFWKYCKKMRNCSWWIISPFIAMFSALFNSSIFTYRDFKYSCLYDLKVVYCICFMRYRVTKRYGVTILYSCM